MDVAYRLAWDEKSRELKWIELKEGETKTYSHDPGTSWWLRRWVDVIGLFPIESQL